MTIDSTPMYRRERTPNYDTRPHVPVGTADEVAVGVEAIAERLRASSGQVIVIECYPGVRPADVHAIARALDAEVVDAADAMWPPDRIDALVAEELTDDEIFGRLTSLELDDLFDPELQEDLRDRIATARERGIVVVHGTGASLLTHGDVLVHADLPRWEIQQRQRRHEIGNLGVDNREARPSQLYKRGYFLDWRLADRLKQKLLPQLDFLLDTTSETPKLITGAAFLRGLEATVRQPFRVVPFFDPGPWGGQWIKQVVGLDPDEINYAWAFDCVPEENSLLLGFGEERVEVPSLDLVFHQPRELLGEGVQELLGDEFPIRFDFLDTMEGGNLSLQVHPLTEYMREHFGHTFTQDESYYMLDCEPDESVVYLGLKDGVDRHEFIAALEEAQRTGEPFDDAPWCNTIPARRHDHFLIPAGTIHCSGRGGMVLEISATPYIFTFKLWDWGRLGLDGRPRPINIERGEANIVWERDATFAKRELVNAVTPLGEGDGWRAERTGLHETEFIETHRHWFTGTVPHHTGRGVNVLNLVQGEEAVIESPTDAFEPLVVHYAETFIVPAAVGAYTIRPHGPAEGTECATVKAFVRGTDR